MCCIVYRGGEYAGYVSFISFKCLMSLCESAPSHRHRAVSAAVAAVVAAGGGGSGSGGVGREFVWSQA